MRFPLTVRKRGLEARIYGRKEGYDYYRVALKVAGKRTTRSFRSLGEAREFAEATLRYAADGHDLARLSRRQATDAGQALRLLHELAKDLDQEKPTSLTDAVTQFCEAVRKLGDTPVHHAVEGYLSTVATVRRKSVGLAVEEFLAERQAKTVPPAAGKRPALSPRGVYNEGIRLRRFAAAFQMDLLDLRKDHLALHFRKVVKRLAAKTRNHERGTLRTWLKWCIERDYLPADTPLLRAPDLRTEKADSEDIELYTAQEFAALLSAADQPLRALLAIGGLAGVRTQELLRLSWGDVWRRPGHIEVTKGKAKTRTRRLAPIRPALASWLEPYADQSGDDPIWPHSANEFHVRTREAADRAGITRRDNGLRHGFISAAYALSSDENAVAKEAGTSAGMIHRNYLHLLTPDEATAWFAVAPPGTARNVVPLALSKSTA